MRRKIWKVALGVLMTIVLGGATTEVCTAAINCSQGEKQEPIYNNTGPHGESEQAGTCRYCAEDKGNVKDFVCYYTGLSMSGNGWGEFECHPKGAQNWTANTAKFPKTDGCPTQGFSASYWEEKLSATSGWNSTGTSGNTGGNSSSEENSSQNPTSVSTGSLVNLDIANVTAGGGAGDCRYFLGMPSWDCHVQFDTAQGTSTLATNIWTIAANVATSITVIAAYLVLGFVIYGGYMYICSNGDVGHVEMGKRTLLRAFIGLAIVLLANVILNAIRVALGANFAQNCVFGEGGCNVDPTAMVSSALGWVIGVAGVVAVIFVVCGGIAYITSAGDPRKVELAKKTLLYACIGLIIVGIAQILTAFVTSIIKGAL